MPDTWISLTAPHDPTLTTKSTLALWPNALCDSLHTKVSIRKTSPDKVVPRQTRLFAMDQAARAFFSCFENLAFTCFD